jgi:hypothetical protein
VIEGPLELCQMAFDPRWYRAAIANALQGSDYLSS